MRLYAETKGNGPDLVLLHGWGMSSSVWASILPDLQKNFRVTCVDLPGHGESYCEDAWAMDDVISALANVLPEKSIVLGWSLGGMLGLRFASLYPQRVKRLILLASSPKFTQSSQWTQAQPSSILAAFSNKLLKNPTATIKRFLFLQTQGANESVALTRVLRGLLAKDNAPQLASLQSGLSILETADLRHALRGAVCPVLLLLGGKDQLVPVGVAEDSIKLNPSIKMQVISEATHVPFLSHPQETVRAINEFGLA